MKTTTNLRDIVRPTGEQAYELARRAGPADSTLLRIVAQEQYKDEALVFGAVNAHRLRALAEQFDERDKRSAEARALATPSTLAEIAQVLRDAATSGKTIDKGHLITIAATLDAAGELVMEAEEDRALWRETAKGIYRSQRAERAANHRVIAELIEELEELEAAGKTEPLVFVIVAGEPAPDELGVEQGMDLALAILQSTEEAA